MLEGSCSKGSLRTFSHVFRFRRTGGTLWQMHFYGFMAGRMHWPQCFTVIKVSRGQWQVKMGHNHSLTLIADGNRQNHDPRYIPPSNSGSLPILLPEARARRAGARASCRRPSRGQAKTFPAPSRQARSKAQGRSPSLGPSWG